ncbi:hypothetical protein ACHAPT_009961 [Fusarium lateritium]
MSRESDYWLRLDMAHTENGTPMTVPLAEASVRRGNIPRSIHDQICHSNNILRKVGLWVGDLLIEPQTVPNFLTFITGGRLPEGRQTTLSLATAEEVVNMTKPYFQWAPAEYHHLGHPALVSIQRRIGCPDDDTQVPSIATELYAMKTRIWEGIPPLSERRWKDLKLDDSENFPKACRYIVAVIGVFQYMNNDWMKKILRTIYNRVWDDLRDCEQAINACRRLAADAGTFQEISLTALWHQYIKSRYDSMCEVAHEWVIKHIQRLRQPVIERLASHSPSNPHHYDEVQWDLTNKLHDLLENAAHADFMICLPMDGYKGGSLPLQEPLGPAPRRGFRENPITWSANVQQRTADYGGRVRYLSRKEEYERYERLGLNPLSPTFSINDPASLLLIALSQIDAQAQARIELRGEPQPPVLNPWLDLAQELLKYGNLGCGYVAYRLCHSHTPEAWDDFKAKFESDISDWGRDVADIDDVRAACKIHWLDGQELGIPDGDVEAAKRHFHNYIDSEEARDAHGRVLLVIDEAVIKSYLDPIKDSEKFVLAVDPTFDPKAAEGDRGAPGYKGTVRVLGSLLWDDLGALLITQSAWLVDIWPLAMSHPHGIYKGPRVTPVLKFSSYEETLRWELACAIIPRLVAYKRWIDSGASRQGP